jgi:hypothetical protein
MPCLARGKIYQHDGTNEAPRAGRSRGCTANRPSSRTDARQACGSGGFVHSAAFTGHSQIEKERDGLLTAGGLLSDGARLPFAESRGHGSSEKCDSFATCERPVPNASLLVIVLRFPELVVADSRMPPPRGSLACGGPRSRSFSARSPSERNPAPNWYISLVWRASQHCPVCGLTGSDVDRWLIQRRDPPCAPDARRPGRRCARPCIAVLSGSRSIPRLRAAKRRSSRAVQARARPNAAFAWHVGRLQHRSAVCETRFQLP